MSKSYVIRSTEQSRNNHTFSLLAIVETILIVLFTWFIAFYYDFYGHIYAAIYIAPFLLLKTPESTNKAIEWFLYEHQFDNKNFYRKPISLFILALSFLIPFIISYFLASYWIINYEGWKLFYMSMLLAIAAGVAGSGAGIVFRTINAVSVVVARIGAIAGVAVVIAKIGVVAGGIGLLVSIIGYVVSERVLNVLVEAEKNIKNNSLKNFLYILSIPILFIFIASLGLMYFLKSIIIKILITLFYTIRYPIKTFFSIANNWQEQTAVNDIFYSPELLPQIHKHNPMFQLSGQFKQLKRGSFIKKLFSIIAIPIWTLGYLYRFSIKSTAWFYFPLAYLTNLNGLQDKNKQIIVIKAQTWKGLVYFNVMVFVSLLLYFGLDKVVSLLPFVGEKMVNITQYISTFLHNYLIPNSIWLIVASVAIYAIIFTVISFKEHIKEEKDIILSNILIYWMIKLIFMLWMVFLGWHVVSIANQHLIPNIIEFLQIYCHP